VSSLPRKPRKDEAALVAPISDLVGRDANCTVEYGRQWAPRGAAATRARPAQAPVTLP
jgi:hypothetical protein